MSLLQTAINTLIGAPNAQVGSGRVSTTPVLPQQPRPQTEYVVVHPVSTDPDADPSTLPQPVAVAVPVPQSAQQPANIPQKLQPVVQELTRLAVSQAALEFGPNRVYGARAVVDVGSKIFQGNVSTNSFVSLQRGLAALAPKSGIASPKVTKVVNTVAGIVNSRLFKAATAALKDFGTTKLPASEYATFSSKLQTSAAADVSMWMGKAPGTIPALPAAASTALGKIIGAVPLPLAELESTVNSITSISETLVKGVDVSSILGGGVATAVGALQSAAANLTGMIPTDVGAIAGSAAGLLGPSIPGIPAGFDPTTATATPNDYAVSASRKVYLKSAVLFNPGDRVDFVSQPRIETAERVEYDIFSPVHAPTGFASYKGSSPKTITVSDIKLVSRTQVEADLNLKAFQLLKSWTKPYFGRSGEGSQVKSAFATVAVTGAPPDILYFYAYSNGQTETTESSNFYRFPVVISNMGYSYPNDVDYIATSSGEPFPIIMTINLELLETRSPEEVERFDLQAYKEGRMVGW